MYDDSAVTKLLDRSGEADEERQLGLNDYLSSFKVATYTVKEGEEVGARLRKKGKFCATHVAETRSFCGTSVSSYWYIS